MKKISRRRFIRKGAAGMAGLTALGSVAGFSSYSPLSGNDTMVDMVDLGRTGIKVPRIAFGTGTFGWRHDSNQRKLGKKGFVDLARYCYDRGIRFIETADMYGTHEFTGEALKELPREKVTVLTKVMVTDKEDWYETEPFEKSLDRFRKDLQTDYIDIMLLHALGTDAWPEKYKYYMDAVSKAQQRGIITTVGVSCHDLGATKLAAEHPWVEVLLAQINNKGPRMEGSPEVIMPVLKRAHDNGKGVIGMKVFGCGQMVADDEREASLNYVIKSGNVDSMTLGLESRYEVDDNIERVMRISRS